MENPSIVRWPATKIFFENQGAKKAYVVNIGGARSSKSYSIAQLFIHRFFTERRKAFLTTRKTMPALRLTAYKVAVDLLKAYGLYRHVEHNKSENVIRWRDNEWRFISIDDPEKIKSAEFNYTHMEEANEFSYEDFMILKLRMSGPTRPGEQNQMFFSLNPSDEHGWLKTKLLKEYDCSVIHSTYRDNPFLAGEYKAMLEGLKDQDEVYWKIYALGEWATPKEIIYEEPTTFPEVLPAKDSCYGLDFGFNNPTALIKVDLIAEGRLQALEKIYQSGLTNSQLIKLMDQVIPREEKKHVPIYADPSEPARIEEISNAGYNVLLASKGVTDGILFVKRYKVQTLPECINILREARSYKWRTDRAGNVLDEPVKFEDHAMDALRYGTYSHFFQPTEFAFMVSRADVY